MEQKDIKALVNDAFDGLKTDIETKHAEKIEEVKNSFISDIEAKGYVDQDTFKSLEDELVKLKKENLANSADDKKDFETILRKGLESNKDVLNNIKSSNKAEETILLVKADEDVNDTNFSGDSLSIATTEQGGLRRNAFSPIWLRSLLPQGTMSTGSIDYLKENGDVGAAGVWDGTGNIADLTAKPGSAPLFTDATIKAIWIAGITRVKRDMVDDIAWLGSYLALRLTVGRQGLFVAENTQILAAFDANSTAYDGSLTNPVEMIYDAMGQLSDNYHNASYVLMNNRDSIRLLALNKASGSGEYDLPMGTVTVIDGVLNINGVPVIGTPTIPANTAYVFDRNETQFLTRMSPKVEFYNEDRDNVVKNLVTVRAEERMAVAVYSDTAIIKVDLSTTP